MPRKEAYRKSSASKRRELLVELNNVLKNIQEARYVVQTRRKYLAELEQRAAGREYAEALRSLEGELDSLDMALEKLALRMETIIAIREVVVDVGEAAKAIGVAKAVVGRILSKYNATDISGPLQQISDSLNRAWAVLERLGEESGTRVSSSVSDEEVNRILREAEEEAKRRRPLSQPA